MTVPMLVIIAFVLYAILFLVKLKPGNVGSGDLIPSGLGSPDAGLSLNARDAPVGGTVARSVPLWSVVVSFA